MSRSREDGVTKFETLLERGSPARRPHRAKYVYLGDEFGRETMAVCGERVPVPSDRGRGPLPVRDAKANLFFSSLSLSLGLQTG